MMILAAEEEEVLLGLYVVVVSLASLFAKVRLLWLFVDLEYVDDRGGCARGICTIFYAASENNLHSRIGRGFPLFTELPRRVILGNPLAAGRIGIQKR